MGPTEGELSSLKGDGDRSLVDAIAWLVLLLSLLLIAPFLLLVTVTSVELLMGFGLFDPALGGDPVLLQHLPAVRPPLVFGAALAALSLLWFTTRLKARPVRWWGTALFAVFGLLLALPFFLLTVVDATSEPWSFYSPYGSAAPLAPVAALCRGLLIPALLSLIVGIGAPLARRHASRRPDAATD